MKLRNAPLARRALLLSLLLAGGAEAQVDTTPQQGLAEHPARHYSIVGVDIVIAPGKRIAGGSIEVRDGLIVDVRKGRYVAPGATLRVLSRPTE